MIMRLDTRHIKIMLCSRMGCAKNETHHLIFLDMDYSQNGPFKVSIQETRFVLKTIKMIDPISKI